MSISSVACFRSFCASSISHTHQLDSSSATCVVLGVRSLLFVVSYLHLHCPLWSLSFSPCPTSPLWKTGNTPTVAPFFSITKIGSPIFIIYRCLLFVSCQNRLSILRISHTSCSHLLCAARARLAPLSVPTIDGHSGSRFLIITHARTLSNHPFISSKNHSIQPPTPLSSFGRFLGGLISWGLKLN